MRLSLLQPVIDRPGPWASVYAALADPTEDAAKQQQLAARATADQLHELGADAATCTAVRDALTNPRDGRPGPQAGRALFAAEGEVVLDTQLPGSPSVPQVAWGTIPRVTPLVEAVGDDSACLVVYVDRVGADFEVHRDSGSESAGRTEGADWPVHRTASADWSERHFQTKVENTWEHNAGEIAEAARQAFEESGATSVLLTGDARERRAVHDRLPEAVRSVTAESEHGGRAAGADTALLERDIAQVIAVQERDRAAGVADRFHAGTSPGGEGAPFAAAGVPALVEAAREHRIDTLLIDPRGADTGREVWVGPGPDQLAVRGSEVHYLGEVHPSAARADDALVRSAVAGGAEVVTLRDPALAPAGGLGAILRWSEPHRA